MNKRVCLGALAAAWGGARVPGDLETWYGPLTNGPRKGTRGNPKDSDSIGGLIPKGEGYAASPTLPGFAGRDGPGSRLLLD